MRQKKERVNLYIENDLLRLISKKAKENYLPQATFIKQLLYANLMGEENNKSLELKENEK
jgi:predicted DNA binding CopG/RHH family protein